MFLLNRLCEGGELLDRILARYFLQHSIFISSIRVALSLVNAYQGCKLELLKRWEIYRRRCQSDRYTDFERSGLLSSSGSSASWFEARGMLEPLCVQFVYMCTPVGVWLGLLLASYLTALAVFLYLSDSNNACFES